MHQFVRVTQLKKQTIDQLAQFNLKLAKTLEGLPALLRISQAGRSPDGDSTFTRSLINKTAGGFPPHPTLAKRGVDWDGDSRRFNVQFRVGRSLADQHYNQLFNF